MGPGFQHRFWDDEASAARFSHPLNQTWLGRAIEPEARILDYGCGYGRTIEALLEMGFRNVTGLDTSQGMLDRARATLPGVKLVRGHNLPSPLDDASFDLVILFAVLTTIPDDGDQRDLIQDVGRLLRPEGYLYVSDLPLQTDVRRVTRYENAQSEGFAYGTFQIDGGRATMRHHTAEWFDDLFSDFEPVEKATIQVATMRGQDAAAVQILLRKPS